MAPKCLGPKLVARNTEVAVVSVACFLLFVSSLTDVAGFVSKLVLNHPYGPLLVQYRRWHKFQAVPSGLNLTWVNLFQHVNNCFTLPTSGAKLMRIAVVVILLVFPKWITIDACYKIWKRNTLWDLQRRAVSRRSKFVLSTGRQTNICHSRLQHGILTMHK